MIPAVKDIYGPTKPFTKFECVGHYHYTRLRILKKKTKQKKHKDWEEKEKSLILKLTQSKFILSLLYFLM